MNGESSTAASAPIIPSGIAKRLQRQKLRQATLILPRTGQRVKKRITLRNSDLPDDPSELSRPLLRSQTWYMGEHSLWERTKERAERYGYAAYDAVTSQSGVDILKCSLAYFLGSLATFVLPIAGLLGHQDGKHMVATVTVYFHPARSAGSMSEATGLAAVAFVYAAFISFSSMAVSVFFGSRDLLELGHVIVLVVFCGAGLGFVGWLKQRLGNPLVNVASSLTSLAIITILTKEGSIQAAKFSYSKVYQVLKMIVMGVAASVAVSFLVKPRSARKSLRQDLVDITDLLEGFLTSITSAFLSGTDDELEGKFYGVLNTRYRVTYNKLVKDLREAKFEHYLLGTEAVYHNEAKLVKCIERIAQSLIGLRSAADTQFDLLEETPLNRPILRSRINSNGSVIMNNLQRRQSDLPAIHEEPEESLSGMQSPTLMTAAPHISNKPTVPADIFALFIDKLGPSMKSLAYTLKEVLSELPFGPAPDYSILVHENFRSSLVDAQDLFSNARKSALELLYVNRVMEAARFPEIAADYEEVAASCGYFSSCLQDLAEDTIAYLDILDDLKSSISRAEEIKSWNWIFHWKRTGIELDGTSSLSVAAQPDPIVSNEAQRNSTPIPNFADAQQPQQAHGSYRKHMAFHDIPWSTRIWRAIGVLRRHDLKHAVKVGIGAVLYAMWAFIPSTRPFYEHWRGEWGLLSYMLVCSMTIGASNTTGLSRFLGTCIGAITAVIVWIISDDNPFILAILGWFVSLGCFYIILAQGKGPMGRFILLTYNLSCLYAYSLSIKDDDDDDDEGGVNPAIWEIVLHRVVAVMTGCLWGIAVTRMIWPISARRQLKDGISVLWLRMGMIWKRDPLSALMNPHIDRSYLNNTESIELQRFLGHLQSLRESASHEFELRGPFAGQLWKEVLDSSGKLIGSFHAMEVVIQKNPKATSGEVQLLLHTHEQRNQLSLRISHLFSVLASSVKLEYPIIDALPDIEHTRDRLLARIFDFRQQEVDADDRHDGQTTSDADFELLYTYALVTRQIAKEISKLSALVEELYGIIDEESLRLG